MNALKVKQIVGSVPYMTLEQGKRMYHLITTYRLNAIIELGFYHGVSTCYLAGALDECGGGSITTIDLAGAMNRRPNLRELLDALKPNASVTWFCEPRSYNWRLLKLLERRPRPRFNLAYIDGGHDWDNSGLAFFLLDKLLRPGAWLVLDDLNWTIERSGTKDARRRPLEERVTPQVRKVWELLIKEHPRYANFGEIGGWGYAQKLR